MKKLLIILLVMAPVTVLANDISIDRVYWDKNNGKANFSLTWKSSWKNSTNHDAAWIFIKVNYPDAGYQHVKLSSSGHTLLNNDNSPKAKLVLPQDQVGVFVEAAQTYRGDVSYELSLQLDPATIKNLQAGATLEVFALEMVYIPAGGFTLGDPDPRAMNYAAFYKSGANGIPNGLYEITAENQVIEVGPANDKLYYSSGRYPQYTGDKSGPVPSTFPKGVNPYYIMKYETSQGFYVDFLNNVSPNLAKTLSPHTTEKYYESRGSIKVANGVYMTEYEDRPCNYITWDDGAALADWAGLRPMTELEFTKAARGPGAPKAHEFPWGTDNTDGLGRFVDLDDNLKLKPALSEGKISNSNRHLYGASYYWVMDLAGSLWEKCVSIGHPIGRNFKGSHGDGTLGGDGTATNEDWPRGIAEEGGYGYRGGGYYQHTMKIGPYNPHSPIAYRTYGSWSGGKRSIAYSQRYVRTAPVN